MAGSPAQFASRTPAQTPSVAASLTADEHAVLTEYRLWRDRNRVPGRGLKVFVMANLGPNGQCSTDGRVQTGDSW